jgi:hypothetical protein
VLIMSLYRIIQNSNAGKNFSKSKDFSEDLIAENTSWARIAPDKVVVATADRAWLCQLGLGESLERFAQPPNDRISVATTQQLLDGAIAAASHAVSSKLKPPVMTPLRWVWRLAGAYYLCHSYPPLIEDAAQRFSLSGRTFLAQWAAEKAREERGHDRLALLDIESMGYDAEAVVNTLVPNAAVNLMSYLARSVQDWDPIDCVGYSYTMERLALRVGEEYIEKVEAILPENVNATRCLRTHSSVGADAEHVEETLEMIAGLTPQERDRVARACYETAILCFSPPKEGYLLDAVLEPILKPLKLNKSF